ncbi:hypothetical protein ACFZAL_03025 [Streptomyces massasporeus]|uniref:hypothetical protein n=1 Tax=Streptomyces massasporeus TaxID=67324 RepID=UPI0036E99E51
MGHFLLGLGLLAGEGVSPSASDTDRSSIISALRAFDETPSRAVEPDRGLRQPNFSSAAVRALSRCRRIPSISVVRSSGQGLTLSHSSCASR